MARTQTESVESATRSNLGIGIDYLQQELAATARLARTSNQEKTPSVSSQGDADTREVLLPSAALNSHAESDNAVRSPSEQTWTVSPASAALAEVAQCGLQKVVAEVMPMETLSVATSRAEQPPSVARPSNESARTASEAALEPPPASAIASANSTALLAVLASQNLVDILSIMKLEPDSCASSAVVSSPDKAGGSLRPAEELEAEMEAEAEELLQRCDVKAGGEASPQQPFRAVQEGSPQSAEVCVCAPSVSVLARVQIEHEARTHEDSRVMAEPAEVPEQLDVQLDAWRTTVEEPGTSGHLDAPEADVPQPLQQEDEQQALSVDIQGSKGTEEQDAKAKEVSQFDVLLQASSADWRMNDVAEVAASLPEPAQRKKGCLRDALQEVGQLNSDEAALEDDGAEEAFMAALGPESRRSGEELQANQDLREPAAWVAGGQEENPAESSEPLYDQASVEHRAAMPVLAALQAELRQILEDAAAAEESEQRAAGGRGNDHPESQKSQQEEEVAPPDAERRQGKEGVTAEDGGHVPGTGGVHEELPEEQQEEVPVGASEALETGIAFQDVELRILEGTETPAQEVQPEGPQQDGLHSEARESQPVPHEAEAEACEASMAWLDAEQRISQAEAQLSGRGDRREHPTEPRTAQCIKAAAAEIHPVAPQLPQATVQACDAREPDVTCLEVEQRSARGSEEPQELQVQANEGEHGKAVGHPADGASWLARWEAPAPESRPVSPIHPQELAAEKEQNLEMVSGELLNGWDAWNGFVAPEPHPRPKPVRPKSAPAQPRTASGLSPSQSEPSFVVAHRIQQQQIQRGQSWIEEMRRERVDEDRKARLAREKAQQEAELAARRVRRQAAVQAARALAKQGDDEDLETSQTGRRKSVSFGQDLLPEASAALAAAAEPKQRRPSILKSCSFNSQSASFDERLQDARESARLARRHSTENLHRSRGTRSFSWDSSEDGDSFADLSELRAKRKDREEMARAVQEAHERAVAAKKEKAISEAVEAALCAQEERALEATLGLAESMVDIAGGLDRTPLRKPGKKDKLQMEEKGIACLEFGMPDREQKKTHTEAEIHSSGRCLADRRKEEKQETVEEEFGSTLHNTYPDSQDKKPPREEVRDAPAHENLDSKVRTQADVRPCSPRLHAVSLSLSEDAPWPGTAARNVRNRGTPAATAATRQSPQARRGLEALEAQEEDLGAEVFIHAVHPNSERLYRYLFDPAQDAKPPAVAAKVPAPPPAVPVEPDCPEPAFLTEALSVELSSPAAAKAAASRRDEDLWQEPDLREVMQLREPVQAAPMRCQKHPWQTDSAPEESQKREDLCHSPDSKTWTKAEGEFSGVVPEVEREQTSEDPDVWADQSSDRAANACAVCSRALRVFCALAGGKTNEVHAWSDSEEDSLRDCGGGPSPEGAQFPEKEEIAPCSVATGWPKAWATVASTWASTRTSLCALAGTTSPPGKRRLQEHLKSDYVFQDEEQAAKEKVLEAALARSQEPPGDSETPTTGKALVIPRGQLRRLEPPGAPAAVVSQVSTPNQSNTSSPSRGPRGVSPGATKAMSSPSRGPRAVSPGAAKAMFDIAHEQVALVLEDALSPASQQTIRSRPSSPAATMLAGLQEAELQTSWAEPQGQPFASPDLSAATSLANSPNRLQEASCRKHGQRPGRAAPGKKLWRHGKVKPMGAVEASEAAEGALQCSRLYKAPAIGRKAKTAPKVAKTGCRRAEWPDLGIVSCVQGVDGHPAFSLCWGASDPSRHSGVGRLELQCIPLNAEEVATARGDLGPWHTLETRTAIGKVLYAGGPSTILAKVDRCVQRFPAHVGNAKQPARVYLTGPRCGDAVALRLRAWSRKEALWTPFGSVLVVVLAETGDINSCSIATSSQLLANIRATAHCGE